MVEEAREIRARAVVMPLPPRRAGASLFGKTLETVLSGAALPRDHPGRLPEKAVRQDRLTVPRPEFH